MKKLITPLLALLLVETFVGSSARAVILAEDKFNGVDAALINADSTVVGGPWVGSGGFTYGSSRLLSATTGSGHLLGINKGAGFFIDNPDLYELSADVFFNSTSANTRLYTVGFTEGNNVSPGVNRTHLLNSTPTLSGRPTIALRADGVVTVASSGVSLFSGALAGYADDNIYSIRLRLDTTTVNWTVNASVYDYTNATETFLDLNGVAAGLTYTYATNPTIQYVGISSNVTAADQANSYMDNFLFQTVVIPEPSTYALIVTALAGLALCRIKARP